MGAENDPSWFPHIRVGEQRFSLLESGDGGASAEITEGVTTHFSRRRRSCALLGKVQSYFQLIGRFREVIRTSQRFVYG